LEEEICGLGLTELRKLKQLEDENNQIKKLVAELSLDKQMLQDVKKSFKPFSEKGYLLLVDRTVSDIREKGF
jgi:hypothetical protein